MLCGKLCVGSLGIVFSNRISGCVLSSRVPGAVLYRVSVLGLCVRSPSSMPSPFSFLVVCFGSRLDLRHYSRFTSTLFASQNIDADVSSWRWCCCESLSVTQSARGVMIACKCHQARPQKTDTESKHFHSFTPPPPSSAPPPSCARSTEQTRVSCLGVKLKFFPRIF